MKLFFKSRFAADIQGMTEWREMRGYTRLSYQSEMGIFDRYCQKVFPDADTLTFEICVSFLDELRKRRSVRTVVSALRNLGKYQIMIGKKACVFPAGYYSHSSRQMPHIMSDEECRRFFDAADHYPYNTRAPLLTYTAAVFFRLQYATGMRPQEVRHLTRQDIDFVHGTVYIADSKLHKDRCIAISPAITEMCRKYHSIACRLYPDATAFFPNKDGKEHSGISIQDLFHRCWTLAGNPDVSGYCSPYILRHSFATRRILEWMEEGKDFDQYMPYLSAYMGHQTFRGTCYYLHLLPERIPRTGCMDISDIVPEVFQ